MWGKITVMTFLALFFWQAGAAVAEPDVKPVASVEIKSADGLKILYSYQNADKRASGASHNSGNIDICRWVGVSFHHKIWRDWTKRPEQYNLQCSFAQKPATSFFSRTRVKFLVSWKLKKDQSYERVGVFVKALGGSFNEKVKYDHCSDDTKVVFHKLLLPRKSNEELKFNFVVKASTKCTAPPASWPPLRVLANTTLHFKGFAGYIE